MGNRLSKIYTKTGDKGTTGLGDGKRIDKDAPRMEAIGTVDELNAHIGLLIASLAEDDSLQPFLSGIQHRLFDLGGELCIPGYQLITEQHITDVEQSLDSLNADLPPLKNFILPAGGEAISRAHLARTVCRRAERCVVTLSKDVIDTKEAINPLGMQYLNRLSDWLFVVSRVLARRDGYSEVLWQQGL